MGERKQYEAWMYELGKSKEFGEKHRCYNRYPSDSVAARFEG